MPAVENVGAEAARRVVASRPWWYHKFEIYPGVVTPGVYDPSGTLKELNLPQDMAGMRILEIGPADGYFTKMMSARGASVVAVDYAARDFYGFATMEKLSGRSFEFHQCNIFDLPSLNLGSFDLIICLGVLYHLPDPLRGLCAISCVPTKAFILETVISTGYQNACVAQFVPGISPNGDYTNFWEPTAHCCEAMLGDVGFLVHSTFLNGNRGMFRCVPSGEELPTKKMRVAYSAHEK
jgi:tRNA (mo5U34)-methyltransferase